MSNYDVRYSKYKSIKKNKETIKWRVEFAYKTPDGVYHKSCKRGFNKRDDGKDWVKTELPKLIAEKEQEMPPVPVLPKSSKKKSKEEMLFSELVEQYMKRSKLRKKESTCSTKESIINGKILPYFKDKKVFDISVEDVENWQDTILSSTTDKGVPYSPTYVRTIRSQFTAIMNYAVRLYGLPFNPLDRAEMMGDKDAEEQPFWQLNEYKAFRQAIADKPIYYYAFEVLFWTGMRMGEMLALNLSDINFEQRTISVDETYHRLNKQDLLTDPKNAPSKRTIHIPEKLADELKEYVTSIYGINKNTRLFQLSKSGLHRELDRGIKHCGITDITVHGLRHSHISLCASSLVNAREVAIAQRVGHSKKTMTGRYTHAYDEDLISIATKLNELMEEIDNVG